MPGQLPELRCDTGEIARGQLRSEKKAGAGPLGGWMGGGAVLQVVLEARSARDHPRKAGPA